MLTSFSYKKSCTFSPLFSNIIAKVGLKMPRHRVYSLNSSFIDVLNVAETKKTYRRILTFYGLGMRTGF